MAKNKFLSGFSRLSGLNSSPTESEGLLEHPTEFREIEVEYIAPNPDQPRQTFSDESIQELAASIRDKGILQPILVTPNPEVAGNFFLIAGERRLRASKLAGLNLVPAVVKQNVDALELAIIENLQRENLNPVEEAEGLLKLKERHGYTDDQLGQVLGKARSSVNELLALTKLPESIKKECRTFDISSRIGLLQVAKEKDKKKQKQLWEAVKTGASVRKLKKMKTPVKPSEAVSELTQRFTADGVSLTIKSRPETPKETVIALLRQTADELSAPEPVAEVTVN